MRALENKTTQIAFGIAILFATFEPSWADAIAVRDLGDLYLQACVRHLAEPVALEDWARTEKLEKLTNPRGLQVFSGSPTGEAWQVLTPDNTYVIAVRPGHGCAVFAGRADPAISTREFKKITGGLPMQFGTPDALPIRTSTGPYGVKTMNVSIGFDASSRQIRSTMMLLTQEHAGGAYQATMQLTLIRR